MPGQKRRGRGRVYLMIFLLALSTAAAVSEVLVTPVQNQISVADQARFTLQIKNREVQTQKYSIYSLGQGWSVDTSPVKDKIMVIPGGGSYVTTLLVDPQEDFVPGIYYVQVTIESDGGEVYHEPLKVYLAPEKPLDYLPSFKVEIDMNEKINPQEPVSVKVFLENRNPLDLSAMTLKIQSDIPEFHQEFDVNLPPLGRKTLEFTIVPNPYQQPKDYVLFFVFERDSQTIKVVEQRIEIQTVLPDFALVVKKEMVWLKQVQEITVTNEGNVRNTQEVTLPLSQFASLLAGGDEGMVLKKEGNSPVAAWEVTLGPQESAVLHLTVQYRLVVYVLVLILAVLGLYVHVHSSVSITKTALTTKSDEEGALSEIKITLEVWNHAKRPLKNVEVIDLVPDIAHVRNSLELGTLKPQEMKHVKEGTRLRWSLAELDAHEHRLLTYKIKAKLNILGVFSLARATVEYKKGKKTRKAYSNIFRLGA